MYTGTVISLMLKQSLQVVSVAAKTPGGLTDPLYAYRCPVGRADHMLKFFS